MPDRITSAAEDDEEVFVVKVGSSRPRNLVDQFGDPFDADMETIKSYAGISTSLRRKTAREIQKVHRGVDGAQSKKWEDTATTASAYGLFDVVHPPYNLEYLAKLNELSAPHYAAVKAKVFNIVGLGYDFVESHKTRTKLDEANEEQTKSLRKKIARNKNIMHDWLSSCNEDDEFTETLIKVWTDYETTGNGYLEIGRTVTGEIGYIGHIPSPVMRIRKKRDGFIQLTGTKVVFFRNFGDKISPNPLGVDEEPNEVIHIKKYSPTNSYYGVPDIVAAQSAVAGNEFSSRFNLDYFENKAVPRYVITMKGGRLGEGSERNILEFFETNLKGKNHRTLYVPLPPDSPDGSKSEFKMEPVESGVQDSSFDSYRKGNLYEILMAHRVPLSKVGVAEGVSLANARDADKTFKESVARPEQSILEKKLNKIIKEKTDIFKLKLNELSLTDEDVQSQIHERYLRNKVLVPNEIRLGMGRAGLPDGDKVIELSAQQNADQKATAGQTRQRDADRASSQSDGVGEGRNEAGAGRRQK